MATQRRPDPDTLATFSPLGYLAECVDVQPAFLRSELNAAGLPADVLPLALGRLALGLAGVKAALVSWHMRPGPQDERDVTGLRAQIDDALHSVRTKVVSDLLDERDRVGARIVGQLQDWNSRRRANAARNMSEEAEAAANAARLAAALEARRKAGEPSQERIDHDDGTWHYEYHFPPEHD